MSRIAENDLLLPALYILYEGGPANTTAIKSALIETFRPTGEDNQILAGRQDTKFTQIVRNLMGSHYSSNGMSGYTTKNERGCFDLTDSGRALVEANLSHLRFLFAGRFPYEQTKDFSARLHGVQGKKHSLLVYSEDDTVSEGGARLRQTKVRERSQLLREAAIQAYTVDGTIVCAACGFDFSAAYGSYGLGYIQIHHEKPLSQYSDDGFHTYVAQAVGDMKPLCANCHCMIHRQRGAPLSVEQLRERIAQARGGQS